MVNGIKRLLKALTGGLQSSDDRDAIVPIGREEARILLNCFANTGDPLNLRRNLIALESPYPEIENARRKIVEIRLAYPGSNKSEFCSSTGFDKIKGVVEKMEAVFQSEFREPTVYERAVLDLLLTPEFLGVEKFRAQLDGLLVRKIDDDGCLELKVKNYQRQFPIGGMLELSEATCPVGEKVENSQPRVHVVLYADDHDHLLELEFWNEVPNKFSLPNVDELSVRPMV